MNKTKIGDKVKMKTSYLSNYVLWISSAYVKPQSDEIDKEDIPEIHFFFDSYIKKIPIMGEVVGYGAYEGNQSGRKNIRVKIKAPGVLCEKYFSETHFTKVNKK